MMSTGYHFVFGNIAKDSHFGRQDEGEGTFLLMDETGTVLPYGYGEDLDEVLEETPEAIIAYAKG
jgi:hypothetical protein